MKTTITIQRTTVETFEVEANSPEEAKQLALQEAQNTDWSRSQAEYEVVE